MSSDSSHPSDPPPPARSPAATDPGLPPVEPPSGQMILRLFVVPAIIVGILVALFLVGPTLSSWVNGLLGRSRGDAKNASQFLRDLDNTNPEVRYRAASDLAQVLLRKEELARDVDFALALAERLRTALDNSSEPEKAFAARFDSLSEGEKAREMKKLDGDRKYIMFLGGALGNFMLPVGAPLLKQMAVQTTGVEPAALAERRGRALFALAALGENLKRFDRLEDQVKDEVLAGLDEASQSGTSASLARSSAEYLRERRRGKQGTLGVVDVLEKCGDDADPFLRELTALASNFWTGSAAEDARIEQVLIRLSTDAGSGEDELAQRLRQNPDSVRSRPVVKRKGFQVQANANIALARRGSPRVRLDLLEEMLNPEVLREIFIIQTRGSADQPNEALVVLTITDSLKALTQLSRKRPELKLERFTARVEELTNSTNATVRAEARQAQLALEGRR